MKVASRAPTTTRTNFSTGVLYPFIQRIQKATGNPITYLIEDNAPAHRAVVRVDTQRRRDLGIITLPWPANSPDMNKIERCWDPLKDSVAKFTFQGASRETVERAKDTLRRCWDDLPQERIDKECCDFHHKCRQVLENDGNNQFDG